MRTYRNRTGEATTISFAGPKVKGKRLIQTHTIQSGALISFDETAANSAEIDAALRAAGFEQEA